MLTGTEAVAKVLDRLGLPATLLSPLAAHAAAVVRASPRLGLVSTGDETAVFRRHTADSLLFALARAPREGENWLDLGSGGGFPGLVLAICYPQARVTLVESNRKKAGFLEVCAIDLGVFNASIFADRAEKLEGGFDVATARAVDDPPRMMQILLGLIRPGGEAIVAGTGEVPDARRVRETLPEVDSPGTLFIMSRPEHG